MRLSLIEPAMPGLVPGIHVLGSRSKKDVDGRDVQREDALLRWCPTTTKPFLRRYGPIDSQQVA